MDSQCVWDQMLPEEKNKVFSCTVLAFPVIVTSVEVTHTKHSFPHLPNSARIGYADDDVVF